LGQTLPWAVVANKKTLHSCLGRVLIQALEDSQYGTRQMRNSFLEKGLFETKQNTQKYVPLLSKQ
jgi:hypothetical protein